MRVHSQSDNERLRKELEDFRSRMAELSRRLCVRPRLCLNMAHPHGAVIHARVCSTTDVGTGGGAPVGGARRASLSQMLPLLTDPAGACWLAVAQHAKSCINAFMHMYALFGCTYTHSGTNSQRRCHSSQRGARSATSTACATGATCAGCFWIRSPCTGRARPAACSRGAWPSACPRRARCTCRARPRCLGAWSAAFMFARRHV